MKVAIICLVLGFVLGLFTGSSLGRKKQKTAKPGRPPREQHQFGPMPEQRSGVHPVISKEAKPSRERPLRKPAQQEPLQEQAAPASPVQYHTETAIEPEENLYQTFQPVGTQSLQFRYSFPATSLFVPGNGYLRSQNNQLLPEQSLFSGMNTIDGYAMNGMLWAFDMVLGEKEYTFAQIMDGQAGTGYVQPCAVLRPAQVEQTNSPGCYRLVRAGKLQMREVH